MHNECNSRIYRHKMNIKLKTLFSSILHDRFFEIINSIHEESFSFNYDQIRHNNLNFSIWWKNVDVSIPLSSLKSTESLMVPNQSCMEGVQKIWIFIGSLAKWVDCSPLARETRVQSQVMSYQRLLKMVLDTSLFNTQHYKVHIKGKVEQSRGRSSALPYSSV